MSMLKSQEQTRSKGVCVCVCRAAHHRLCISRIEGKRELRAAQARDLLVGPSLLQGPMRAVVGLICVGT